MTFSYIFNFSKKKGYNHKNLEAGHSCTLFSHEFPGRIFGEMHSTPRVDCDTLVTFSGIYFFLCCSNSDEVR